MANFDETKCKQRISSGNWGRTHPCSRLAVKDGFCKQHHPDSVNARKMKSEKLFKEKQAKDPLRIAWTQVAKQKAIIEDLVELLAEALNKDAIRTEGLRKKFNKAVKELS